MLPIPSYLADRCIDQNITKWNTKRSSDLGFILVIGPGSSDDLDPSLVEVITQNQGNQVWQISAIKWYKQFSNIIRKRTIF